MISYNADSGNLYGSLGFYPVSRYANTHTLNISIRSCVKLPTFCCKAKQHPAGAKREIWDWDGSFYLGSIDEVNETFNVVGNVNEVGSAVVHTVYAWSYYPAALILVRVVYAWSYYPTIYTLALLLLFWLGLSTRVHIIQLYIYIYIYTS